MRKPVTVSELIKILSKMQTKYGDIEISVNTQEGGSYSLYSKEDIQIAKWYNKSGNVKQTIEIG